MPGREPAARTSHRQERHDRRVGLAIEGLPALAGRGVPLLVIHGEDDPLIPVRHGRRLAAAYGAGAETLFAPGAGHVRSYVTDPGTYVDRLVGFFARAE